MARAAVALLGAALEGAPPTEAAWELTGRPPWGEELGGLLYQQCLARRQSPPAVAAYRLQQLYHRNAARNLVAWERLGAVVAWMGRRHVPLMVLPGAALLSHYPDAGCRAMDDIDVLPPPGAVGLVAQAADACGLRPVRRHPGLYHGDGLTLDVHTDLFNSDRVSARRGAVRVSLDELWSDSADAALEGVPVRVLALEDAVLYVSLHAMRHSYSRPVWLVDLALLLAQAVDWRRLVDKARRYRMVRPLAYGALLLQRTLAHALPCGLAAALDPFPLGPVERRLVQAAFEAGERAQWGDILWSYSMSGTRQRAVFLAATAFPRPAVMLQVYPRLPRALVPLAYMLRCAQLVSMAARSAVMLIRRPGR